MKRLTLFILCIGLCVPRAALPFWGWSKRESETLKDKQKDLAARQKKYQEVLDLKDDSAQIESFSKLDLEGEEGSKKLAEYENDSEKVKFISKLLASGLRVLAQEEQEIGHHFDDSYLKRVGQLQTDGELALFKIIASYVAGIAADKKVRNKRSALRKIVSDEAGKAGLPNNRAFAVLHSPLFGPNYSFYPNLSLLKSAADFPVLDTFAALEEKIDWLDKQSNPDEWAQTAADKMQQIEDGWHHLPPFDAAMLMQQKDQLAQRLKPHHQRWVRKKYDANTSTGLKLGAASAGLSAIASALLWYNFYQSRRKLAHLLRIPVAQVDPVKIIAAYNVDGASAFGGGHDWIEIQAELKAHQKMRSVLKGASWLTAGLGSLTGGYWLWRKLRAPVLPA